MHERDVENDHFNFLLDVVARVYVSMEFIKACRRILGSNKIMERRVNCLFETSAAERELEKIRDPRATYSERRLRLKFVLCVICVIILIRILQVNYYNLSPSSLVTPFLMSLSFLPLVILLKFYVVSLLYYAQNTFYFFSFETR